MKIKYPHRIDKFIPWMFVLFFVVIMSVDAIFATLAIKTHSGVVNEKAYETGLHYNKIINDVRTQKNLGWSHVLTVSKDGTIEFSLKDKAGVSVQNAEISVLCYRAVKDGMDINLKLKETTPGKYTGKPNYHAVGAWRIFLTAKKNETIYKANQDIVIKK